jgi:hypothetical protein
MRPNDLASLIANQHDISQEAALAAILVHTDQITDDPDLYSPEAEELTNAGVKLVTEAIAESYRQVLVSTKAGLLLQQIEIAEQERANLKQQTREALMRRDELVCRAFNAELPRDLIATAAGINKARLYQIRDGRR